MGGGLQKCLNILFFENDEQKISKNTEKLQSSSHKWVFGKTYEKEKNVWEKIREGSVYVFVCGGLRLLRKKTVLHVPQKHPSTAPSHLAK